MLCLTQKETPEEINTLLKSNNDASIIFGSQLLLKSSLEGPIAVSCRSYPTVDCEDYSYKVSPETIRAGLCKYKASAPAESKEESAEMNSAE